MSDVIPEMVVYAGEDTTWTADITNDDDTPMDLTGSSVHFTVKSSLADLDATAEIDTVTTSHTDAVNGETTIPIDLTGASDSVYTNGAIWMGDIWVVDSAGEKIPQGLIKVVVKPAATRTF